MKTKITRVFSLLFILFLVGDFCHGQITKEFLDSVYKNHDTASLRMEFEMMHLRTMVDFEEIQNDSLVKMSELFFIIFPTKSDETKERYFFIQETYNHIDKKTQLYSASKFLVGNSSYKSEKALKYDRGAITEIQEFIGAYPTSSQKIVNDSLNQIEEISPEEISKAKNIIAEYNNRIHFISSVLVIPGTWGHINLDLVPYKINSIEFNSEMTEVEVKFSKPASGGTIIYQFHDDKWIKHRVLMQSID